MKRVLTVTMLLCAIGVSAQHKTEVREFNLAGPYAVAAPFGLDTVDVQGKKFDEKSLMDAIALTSEASARFSGQVLPSLADSRSVGMLTFYINNSFYKRGTYFFY